MNTFYHNSVFKLKIAESIIQGADLGVYTLEDIPAGAYIDECTGDKQEFGGYYAHF